MLEDVIVLKHSSIRIARTQTIYIDPFKIEKKYNDADFIFITHSHFDHFSPEDILKIKKEETRIITPEDLREEIEKIGFDERNVLLVKPNNEYNID